MQVFGWCLLLVCLTPVTGQYPGCLSAHFNCVIDRVSGQFYDNNAWITQSTEQVYYDEVRQMVVHKVSGQDNNKPFWEMRIFDYPKRILYYITRPGEQEICSKSNLTEHFKKICLPKSWEALRATRKTPMDTNSFFLFDNTQEIWLKSPLGTENNMVPTVRFKWEMGGVTTELTYTYFKKPVIQNWYGMSNELRNIQLFETAWYTNITVNDMGPAVFTPPKSCENAVFETKRIHYKQTDTYLRF